MKAFPSLLRSDIIEDARHPRHFGALEGAQHVLHASNPTCGDELTLYLRVQGSRFNVQKIQEASFVGRGCMVMMASASRFTDTIRGKTLRAAATMTEQQALQIFGSPLTPSRQMCALLPLRALQHLHPLDKSATRYSKFAVDLRNARHRTHRRTKSKS